MRLDLYIWVARLQNETVPENFNSTRETLEKREKDPKNDLKRAGNILALSGRLKIFHRHFSKSSSPPKICKKKSFTARLCRGSHTNIQERERAQEGAKSAKERRLLKMANKQISGDNSQKHWIMRISCGALQFLTDSSPQLISLQIGQATVS